MGFTPQAFLLGYDLRQHPCDTPAWSESFRAKYQFPSTIDCPTSVDPDAWKRIGERDDRRHPYGLMSFADATELASGWNAEASMIVRVSVYPQNVDEQEFWQNIFSGYNLDCENVDGVAMLGYDVADRFLLSSLTNCDFTSDEVNAFRSRLSSTLNNWGLFGEYEDAKRFVLFSN